MMKQCLTVATGLLIAVQPAGAAVDYSRDILPILSDKCYHCHGPDEGARKAKLRLDTREGAFREKDPVIVPGQSSQSELISRITTDDADDQMPPPGSNRTLTPQQIDLLKRWVDDGAQWGRHWAFEPLPSVVARPVISKSVDRDTVAEESRRQRIDSLITNLLNTDSLITDHWLRHPIDSFILARLQKEKLQPSPEADKATLLRRVTLDLTGVPPTLQELDAFSADTATNAYEKVVDRLLASPRFGERMATEWLDLARYADTHGYQMDRFRPMWPYRDWVIKAFNENLPYDQFVTWQLAGDLLPDATRDQRLATAFNRLHNQNEEGGIVEEEYRVAYVTDRVNTFATAFLGLTTECARCHDHKYDPLSQRDFYSLSAFFQNIDESGQTSYFTDAMPVPTLLLSTEDQDRKLDELRAKIEAEEKRMARLRRDAKNHLQEFLKSLRSEAEPTEDRADLILGLVGHFTFDEIVSNKVANVAGTNFARAQEGPTLVPGRHGLAAALTGENGFTFPGLGHFTRADSFTLALWLKASAHAERFVVVHHSKAPIDAGSRGYELLLENGRVAFGLHHMWPENSLKVVSRAALPTNQWKHVTVSYDGSSRARGVTLFFDGVEMEHEVIRDGLKKDITYGGGEPDLAIGYRFRDSGFKDGVVDDFRIYRRALTAIEVADVAGTLSLRERLAKGTEDESLLEYFTANHHPPTVAAENDLHRLRRAQANLVNAIPEIMAMVEMAEPRPAYILKRGAYDSPGERVSADTPKVLPPFPRHAPRNRLGLAQWLLQPDHPLFARVTVNRAWQMMFGRGLVETSDNFGSQGAQPTHPELLDWLAREFAAGGVPTDRAETSGKGASAVATNTGGSDLSTRPWDFKRLLKTIAVSATYRQSSKAAADLLSRDPHNALLARGPANRLSAEMLRDQALAFSGLLVDTIGGPSVKPYQPEGVWEIAMGKPKYERGKGDDMYRRSLYTFWKRTVPPPSMVTFDAADRSYCTAQRQTTSTPLQALALLNDVQLVEAARFMGQRMLKEGGASADAQLSWLFRLVTARSISQKELAVIKRLFTEQREIFAADEAATRNFLEVGDAKSDALLPSPELAAASVVAQTLLNHDAAVMRR